MDELDELLKYRFQNREKTLQLLKDLDDVIDRLKTKHPIYGAISSLEKMRADLLSAHENLEKMVSLMGTSEGEGPCKQKPIWEGLR